MTRLRSIASTRLLTLSNSSQIGALSTRSGNAPARLGSFRAEISALNAIPEMGGATQPDGCPRFAAAYLGR
jgi:hypothetical protein